MNQSNYEQYLYRDPRDVSNGKKLTLIPIAFTLSVAVLTMITKLLPETGATGTLSLIFLVLSIIGVVSMFFLLPIGIPIWFRKRIKEDAPYDKRSGKGDKSELPEEVRRWSWGAALMNNIWLPYYGGWLWYFLQYIPYVAIPIFFVVGFRGGEHAWRNWRWMSVDHYKEVERKWLIGWLVLVAAGMITAITFIIILPLLLTGGDWNSIDWDGDGYQFEYHMDDFSPEDLDSIFDDVNIEGNSVDKGGEDVKV